ncbi:oxidoreductase [Paenibacillus taiwanensis]|uniref:oxidoreductase n=1 Tax=Paenibacillus taiwanensis TaxID=401638 RepID=UPI00040B1A0D|nr:oxidoreductase [Paenibacillus taiwanensis]
MSTSSELTELPSSFYALVVDKDEQGRITPAVKEIAFSDLPDGDVTIQVAYSSLNYKDALACSPDGNIVKNYPFIPGIDASGIVVASKDERYQPGQAVIVTGYEMGVSHFGGYSQYVRVPGDWLVPLPTGLSLRDAMVFGTAGLTATLSVKRLEQHGIKPEDGQILVTGASGGVGSLAIAMLAKLGFRVTAASGKKQAEPMLRALGAAEVVSREAWLPERPRSLDKQKWAGAVDVCGGDILAAALASVKYGGAVAASGLTSGGTLPTTVYPFILRGITLYGIDSVYTAQDHRVHVWARTAWEWSSISQVEGFVHEVTLQELPALASRMLQSQMMGRTIIRIAHCH